MAFGPPMMGTWFDRTGNYIGALWMLTGIVVLGTVLITLLGRYSDSRMEGTGP